MVDVNYPVLSIGGTAWFSDLNVTDPYYALPLISTVTMGLVTLFGIEMGTSTDQTTPEMWIGMQYVLPIIFGVSSQFATAFASTGVPRISFHFCMRVHFELLRYINRSIHRRWFNNQSPKSPKNSFKELLAGYKANTSNICTTQRAKSPTYQDSWSRQDDSEELVSELLADFV